MDVALLIEDGRIRLTKAELDRGAEETIIDATGKYVLPAFMDIHSHGAVLFDFTSGEFDTGTGRFDRTRRAYDDGVPRYAAYMASCGVANVYPGLLACADEQLHLACAQWERYMASHRNGTEGALVKGAFLEGSFLNPCLAGVQNRDYAYEPDIERFDELNREAAIRIVNVVPDYGASSARLTRHLTRYGITVGAGHTGATKRQFEQAIESGLKYCIHFTNGPMGQSFKPSEGGGAIEAVLSIPDLYAELIVDGYHVNFAYVRDIIARKGIDRIIASTDSMFATGTQDVHTFSISGVTGEVSPQRDHVIMKDKPSFLFASLLTMDKAFSNLLSLLTRRTEGIWYGQHPAMPFDEALAATCRMCSGNVNDMLSSRGHEDQQTGAIEEGKWADLIIGHIEGTAGSYNLAVGQVFVHGCEVVPSHWDRA